jgi:hypothetical protein
MQAQQSQWMETIVDPTLRTYEGEQDGQEEEEGKDNSTPAGSVSLSTDGSHHEVPASTHHLVDESEQLIEAHLVVVPPDGRGIEERDLAGGAAAERILVMAEPADAPCLCVPRTKGSTWLCFGIVIATLLAAIAIAGIVCGSGSCSRSSDQTPNSEEELVSSGSPINTTPYPTPIMASTPSPTSVPTLAPVSDSPTLAPTTILPALNLPNYTLQTISQDQYSPQAKAYFWFEKSYSLVNLEDMEQWCKHQLFGLATLFYALEGSTWDGKDRQNWLKDDLSECEWATYKTAIACDNLDRVVFISLMDFEKDAFYGTIPPEIELLPSLRSIQIDNAGYTEALGNVLPTEIGNLQHLKQVRFAQNRLGGTLLILDNSLAYLTQIATLDLQNNDLSGTLTTELGLLTSLTSLYLNGTSFGGRFLQNPDC